MAETLKRLGKYEILEEIGRGAFAVVYKGRDTDLDRIVALKVLHSQLTTDPQFVQRFQREARVAANLDHPNIATIYEVNQIGGAYFIAMQFLEGRALSQILEAEGALPVSRVQAVIRQIASALDYAHARGFVHRDVKPSNVIVAGGGRATLTDFGLVKAGEGTQLSTTGMVFGTPEYMSPEQIEGVKDLDARSDVYSLGVMAYKMLTGRAPFVADAAPTVMYKHVHEPPPLDELPSDLPQSVVAVVEKALAKKREERYQSAGEMARALEEATKAGVELPPTETVRIFLSYVREDEEKVESLYQKLSEKGFKPWMDKKDILPGEDWELSIRRAIRSSDFFLACLSANSVNRRGFLQKEIKDALDIWQEMLDSDIYLIPVRLEDCEMPESLRRFQRVDLFEKDGWTRLVKAIQVGMERRGKVVKPIPTPSRWRRRALALGGLLGVLVLVMGVIMEMRSVRGNPTPTPPTWEAVTAVASVVLGPKTITPSPSPSLTSLPTITAADTPAPTRTLTPTATPTVAIAATQTASADEETATLQATTTATAAAFTPSPIPTQTPVLPTATATDTPKLATPTSIPTAVPPSPGPVALTIYFRDTLTEAGFAALSGDQVLNGGMLYEEGKFMYGEAAVQIGDMVYHFDKPEVEPGEPEQLPDPWRVEFEFAEALVAHTGNQAGFNAKAQFWVGTLDGSSAVGEENPYSLTMRLYEGNELRESIQVFFTVKDAPEGGGGGGGGGKPLPP
jgi:serine/threonine protein kinase